MIFCFGVGSASGSRFFLASKISLRDSIEDSLIGAALPSDSNEDFPAVNLVVGMIKKKEGMSLLEFSASSFHSRDIEMK